MTALACRCYPFDHLPVPQVEAYDSKRGCLSKTVGGGVGRHNTSRVCTTTAMEHVQYAPLAAGSRVSSSCELLPNRNICNPVPFEAEDEQNRYQYLQIHRISSDQPRMNGCKKPRMGLERGHGSLDKSTGLLQRCRLETTSFQNMFARTANCSAVAAAKLT